VNTPSIDWLGLAPVLAPLAAASLALLGSVLVPRRARRPFAALVVGAVSCTAAALIEVTELPSARRSTGSARPSRSA
jgi:hypothetical protein